MGLGCQAESEAPTAASSTTPTKKPPPVPTTPVPAALAELLQQVPRKSPPSTGPDGGTTIGSDTGVVASSKPLTSARARRQLRLRAGSIKFQRPVSSPAVEHALRETTYWNLAKKCTGPDGHMPPPDAITMEFTIRSDGTIDPGSIRARASDDRYRTAAECAVSELGTAHFHGPVASRQRNTRVRATWPSTH